ncbi:hypothetical protein GOL30_27380 [Sinorhizobium medicae]|uniref:Uncharacterized protein n=2 Tax=Sinorhizobium medicae TaxID=110321 RepID=A6UF42_SINMW|nr:hypothetical protein [Sinorhizobium medicae]ABR62272.1 hypothetical protein Smed_3454 [Sinorhizobium medicae WSM419]MBO1940849.1 hypothetical protein [Sinorhizobium medicae]MBO1964096.1 hypothetical protein [Sinorhizobium medicae]MDX0405845.1 hypothetical protein [Sinorhizobium medicae]MDX0411406.1 hypothetical protein [Sinorhizobium medicae]
MKRNSDSTASRTPSDAKSRREVAVHFQQIEESPARPGQETMFAEFER